LKKDLNLKTRYELIGDFDYLDQLTEEEKDYLNRFYEEFINANFKHKGERVHPVVNKTKKVKATGRIRQVDTYKQDCEHRNNSRNRCVYTKAKAQGLVTELETTHQKEFSNVEDRLNYEIDKKLFKKSN
jgi:hypothetical protein